jgi:hypothetical protein
VCISHDGGKGAKEEGQVRYAGKVKENEVGVGIAGANLRVRRWAKVFREEIESETGTSMGTGQISMPGNTAQMGYDYLGQMTSRNVMLTATLFRPIRSLFLMTVARGYLHQPSSGHD